jgi:predicted  nucleic acid-binding Zn-ribbon protein
MDEIEQLKQEIEKLRKNLLAVAENHQLSDPEVVGASRLLDAALNEYEKLLARKRSSNP